MEYTYIKAYKDNDKMRKSLNELTINEYHEDDCTLFIIGKDLESIENKKLIFPTLSHA